MNDEHDPNHLQVPKSKTRQNTGQLSFSIQSDARSVQHSSNGLGLRRHFTVGSELKVDEQALKDKDRPFYAAAVANIMSELERSVRERSERGQRKKKDKKRKRPRPPVMSEEFKERELTGQISTINNGQEESLNFSEKDGGTGAMRPQKVYRSPATRQNEANAQSSQEVTLEMVDQPFKRKKFLNTYDVDLLNQRNPFSKESDGQIKTPVRHKSDEMISLERFQDIEENGQPNKRKSGPKSTVSENDSDPPEPTNKHAMTSHNYMMQQSLKSVAPVDENLVQLLLQTIHKPLEKQAVSAVQVEQQLNEIIDTVWEKEAFTECKQLRELQEAIKGQLIHLISLDKFFRSQFNPNNNSALSQINEEVENSKGTVREQRSDVNENQGNPLQQQVESFMVPKNNSADDKRKNKGEVAPPNSQNSFQVSQIKPVSGVQSKVQGTMSNSDISFFDNSGNSDLPDEFKQELLEQYKKNQEGMPMIEEIKEDAQVESISCNPKTTIKESESKPSIKDQHLEALSQLPPGDFNGEIARVLLMFKQVEGNAMDMQEYLDFARSMSENIVEDSFMQNELINGLSEQSGFSSQSISVKSPINRQKGTPQKKKESGSNAGGSQRSISQNQKSKEKEKGDIESQSNRSKSSFYRLQNDNSLSDSEPSGLSSSLEDQDSGRQASLSSQDSDQFADSLKGFKPANSRKGKSSSAVPDTIEELEESKSDGKVPDRSHSEHMYDEKHAWLHQNQVIREDSKENSSNSDSKKNDASFMSDGMSRMQSNKLGTSKIEEMDEEYSKEIFIKNKKELEPDFTDFDLDDIDEYAAPKDKASSLINEKQKPCDLVPQENKPSLHQNMFGIARDKKPIYDRVPDHLDLPPLLQNRGTKTANASCQTDQVSNLQKGGSILSVKSAQQPNKKQSSTLNGNSDRPDQSYSKLLRENKKLKLDLYKTQTTMNEIQKRLETVLTMKKVDTQKKVQDQLEGLNYEHVKALIEQNKTTFETLDLGILMLEKKIQETRLNLKKSLLELDGLVSSQTPILQAVDLASLVFCKQVNLVNISSSKKSGDIKTFDLPDLFKKIFGDIVEHRSQLNEALGKIELNASVRCREHMTCLWAIVGEEDRVRRSIQIAIDHMLQTIRPSNSSRSDKLILEDLPHCEINVDLNLINKESLDDKVELSVDQDALMKEFVCQFKIRSNLKLTDTGHRNYVNSKLNLAYCDKILQQMKGNLNLIDQSTILIEIPLQTSNPVLYQAASQENNYTFLTRVSHPKMTCSNMEKYGSSWVFGSIQSSSDNQVYSRLYKSNSSRSESWLEESSPIGSRNNVTQSRRYRKDRIQAMPYIEVNQINVKMDEIKALIRRNNRRLETLKEFESMMMPRDSESRSKTIKPLRALSQNSVVADRLLEKLKKNERQEPVVNSKKRVVVGLNLSGSSKSGYSLGESSNMLSRKSSNAVSYLEQLKDQARNQATNQQATNKIPNFNIVSNFNDSRGSIRSRDNYSHGKSSKVDRTSNQPDFRKKALKDEVKSQANPKRSNNSIANNKRDAQKLRHRGTDEEERMKREAASNKRSHKNSVSNSISSFSRKHISDNEKKPSSGAGSKKRLNKSAIEKAKMDEQSPMSIRLKPKFKEKKSHNESWSKIKEDSAEQQESSADMHKIESKSQNARIGDFESPSKRGNREETKKETPESKNKSQAHNNPKKQRSAEAKDDKNSLHGVSQSDGKKEICSLSERGGSGQGLESSDSQGDDISVCVSDGDQDKQQSIAANLVRAASLMGSVVGGSVADQQSQFNGSNFGGTIFGGGSQTASECSYGSSDDSSDNYSSASSENGEAIQRAPVQAHQVMHSANVGLGSNANLLNMEEIKECSSDTDPTSEKDESGNDRKSRGSKNKSKKSSKSKKSVVSLNKQLAILNHDIESIPEEEAERNMSHEKGHNKSHSFIKIDEEKTINVLVTGKTQSDLMHFSRFVSILERKTEGKLKIKLCHLQKSNYETMFAVEKQLKKLLNAFDHALDEKVTHEEGTQIIEDACDEQYDLILLDLEVADQDLDALKLCKQVRQVYESCREAKRVFIKMPMIFGLTGLSFTPNMLIQMGQAGFDPCVYQKPLTEETVKEILMKI